MLTFVAVVHVIVAVLLVGMVLVQDTKSGAVGGVFGGGSNSLLGASGGISLASKITQVLAITFAITSVTLWLMTTRKTTSVIDASVIPNLPPPPAAQSAPAPTQTSSAPGTQASPPTDSKQAEPKQ